MRWEGDGDGRTRKNALARKAYMKTSVHKMGVKRRRVAVSVTITLEVTVRI